jgi:hypothetical protein
MSHMTGIIEQLVYRSSKTYTKLKINKLCTPTQTNIYRAVNDLSDIRKEVFTSAECEHTDIRETPLPKD